MRFLEHTLIWEWCREHGFAIDEPEGPVAPRLADDPALRHRERSMNTAAADPARARHLAHTLAASLGAWDECLVWATDWDVWTYAEDWPRYYAWRGRFGERRSLGTAPGTSSRALMRHCYKSCSRTRLNAAGTSRYFRRRRVGRRDADYAHRTMNGSSLNPSRRLASAWLLANDRCSCRAILGVAPAAPALLFDSPAAEL